MMVAAAAATAVTLTGMITTVPAWIADVLLSPLSGFSAAKLHDCGRRIGNSVEVDVDAVRSVCGDHVASGLLAYQDACRKLWADRENGVVTVDPWLLVERPLTSARATETRERRTFLGDWMTALRDLDGVGGIVGALLGGEPNLDELTLDGQPFAWSSEQTGTTTLVRFVTRQRLFPDLLGGHAGYGEVARQFRLEVNHAAWRTSAAKRLVAVEVQARELVADPGPFRSRRF
jgi:hypothetical protein